MNLIDGKALAQKIREEVKNEIAASGLRPKLAVLLVGDDPASHIYVNLKEKAAHEVGIETDIRRLPSMTSDEELKKIIQDWNLDETVNAILIQVPLPPGHDTEALIATMDPKKDADGFHPATIVVSPVHESILRLIGSTDVVLKTATAVILANSDTFAEPLAKLLTLGGSRVETFAADELDVEIVRRADIVIVALGRPSFLKRDMVKPGACIIDVGTTRLPDGKIVGDVDAGNLKDVPGWLSPVPGGVGPMTVACLLKNTIHLALSSRRDAE